MICEDLKNKAENLNKVTGLVALKLFTLFIMLSCLGKLRVQLKAAKVLPLCLKTQLGKSSWNRFLILMHLISEKQMLSRTYILKEDT